VFKICDSTVSVCSSCIALQGKHSNFAGVSDPEVLEPDDRFMVRLAGIPHVQQHVEVLLFRSSFEGEAMHVSPLLSRKILHPVIATPGIMHPSTFADALLPTSSQHVVLCLELHCISVQGSTVSCTSCLAWALTAAHTVMTSIVMYCSGGGAVIAYCGSL